MNLEALTPATNSSATVRIAGACGMKAMDPVLDLSEIIFGDEQEVATREAAVHREDEFLQPEEIIGELQKIGPKVALASIWTRSCIAELQAALRLVRGTEDTERVKWRIKGAPVFPPTAAEKAERLELLLGEAFSLVTSMTTVCKGKKGYDTNVAAVLGRVEASLERFSDSPETFKEAALAVPAQKKTAQSQSFNR